MKVPDDNLTIGSDKHAQRFPLSIIILTLNESPNIVRCLSFLDWADEVILIDSHSTDDTIAMARRVRPDVRVLTNRFEDFGQQRNWALDHAHPRHEWVLFLDADELCNEACARAIRSAVQSPGGNAGFYLCYRNHFLGRWIKHCTLFPTWQLRLLKKGHVRYRKEGHGQREVLDGPADYLHEPYDHFGFSKGVSDWIARHNLYSSNEVDLIQQLRHERLRLRDMMGGAIARRRCLKRIAARVGFRPVLRFVYLYLIRGGFLDGWPGFLFCLLRASHEVHITVKLAEARCTSSSGMERCAPAVKRSDNPSSESKLVTTS